MNLHNATVSIVLVPPVSLVVGLVVKPKLHFGHVTSLDLEPFFGDSVFLAIQDVVGTQLRP
jgi:hypothetical protein